VPVLRFRFGSIIRIAAIPNVSGAVFAWARFCSHIFRRLSGVVPRQSAQTVRRQSWRPVGFPPRHEGPILPLEPAATRPSRQWLLPLLFFWRLPLSWGRWKPSEPRLSLRNARTTPSGVVPQSTTPLSTLSIPRQTSTISCPFPASQRQPEAPSVCKPPFR
jgi:hypothetical protein